MGSCVGTILSFLFNESVMKHLGYVFKYEVPVHRLEQENRRLGEKKERIQRLVDIATRNGRFIETEVSSWLGEVEQMERDIANFLRQQENREQMERDFANFLRQQENKEQMERDFGNILRQQVNGEHMERDIANFLRQQENGEQMEQDFANFRRQQDFANFLRQQQNGEQIERDLADFLRQQGNGEQIMERDFANFLRQQENGEQMERDFAKFMRQQENGKSFKCFPGCMCPNLLWRYKSGKDADDKMLEVTKLISRGELLQTSTVARSASFQSEPLFDSPDYYTTLRSRASVFADIMNALINDSGVDMIGVHGPGGAGKTTMVKEVAKEAKRRRIFDEIVIAVVSKDPNTSKLQEDLALQLVLKYEQKNNELGRADELRKALSNGKRKILVILDDLWQALDLKAIGIPISGPGDKGCKIMLTSRRQDVFKGMGVHSTFSIGYLEEQEAWELFRKVTGDFGVKDSIARKVCEKCADLPIAIVAVGAALKGEEEEDVWQNALCELGKSRLKYIEGVELVGYTPLKLSYDSLKDEGAKSCFLLCCLFPEDAEISIDDLVRCSFALRFLGREVDTLKDARIKVQSMVYMLKRSCLLLNVENKNCVKMHDVMRDLAVVITWEKQTEHGGGHDWPGQQQFMVKHDIRELPNNDASKHHTAISLRINDNFTFPCGVLDCPPLHTFVLEKTGYSDSHIIPNSFFQGTKKATVLDLKNISLEFPSSVLKLNHLRMLRLSKCKLLGDLTTIQDLKDHIEILSFEKIKIKELPQEIGELIRLRILDLSDVWELKVIPKGVISKLIHLEELYVLSRFSGWDTTVDGGGMSNASIDELKSLTQLTVLHIIISAESFKIMIQECPKLFEKLINFAIFINFPSSFLVDRIQTLNVLDISDIHRTDYEFHHLMDKVFHLLVDKVTVLKLRRIPRLEGLFLHGKPQLKVIPSGGGPFSKLTFLEIDNCHGMKYLFSSSIARALQQLQELKVSCCSKMEQIIGLVDHHHGEKVVTDETIIFSRLQHLILWELPEFKSFYPRMEKTTSFTAAAEFIFDEKDACPNLKTLYLRDLKSTREIQLWDLDSTQEHPHKVRLIGCQVSTKVLSRHMRRSFRIINNLSLKNCQGFKHVIDLDDTISVCEELFVDVERLKLNDLPELVSLWNKNLHKIESLQNLKYINIGKCPQMKSLLTHSMATTLQHLKTLVVECCGMMEEIIIIEENNSNTAEEEKVAWQIEFSKLEYLILIGLPNLKNFCNDERGSFSFSSLRGVSVKNCPKMKTFVSGQICSLPRMMMRAVVGDEKVEITNLNAYFETRNEDSNHTRKIIHWGGSFDFNELWDKEGLHYAKEIQDHIYPGDGFESESDTDFESEFEFESELEF